MDRRTFVKLTGAGIAAGVVGVPKAHAASVEPLIFRVMLDGRPGSFRRVVVEVDGPLYPGWEACSVWERSEVPGSTAFMHFEERGDSLWVNPGCSFWHPDVTLEDMQEGEGAAVELRATLDKHEAACSDEQVTWMTLEANGQERHVIATLPEGTDLLDLPIEIIPREGEAVVRLAHVVRHESKERQARSIRTTLDMLGK